jgi:cobalt-zinc-cadmium resistance protein CzcA
MESLMRAAVGNRLLVLTLGLLVMGAGAYGYTRLPIDAFPDVSPNLVQVFTVTEGLAPEEIEKYVTYPIEASMTGLPGARNIRSVSNFGLSVVNVYFEDDVDIYFARQLVGERLGAAAEQIPEGFGEPEMGPISTGMGLVLFYYLEDETGKRSLTELRTIQDWIVKFHLQTVPGVTEVLGIGGWEKQFQVVLHPDALLRYDLSVPRIIETIRANNRNVGAQFIEKNSEELVVRSIGLATGLADLERIIVKTEGGTPVFLRDLGEIRIGGAVRRGAQTRNGAGEVVAGMVIKLFGTNSSTVISRVEERMRDINRFLPEGVKLVPYYEQKTLVQACVGTVTGALLQGILLVAVVLAVFMASPRASLITGLSIPFSALFAFLGMRFFGISANLMSLGGIAIAIGMLVDGTIVIVENVDRLLRSAPAEEPRARVVARACAEVARPIAFAISIVIVVFIPLFTLQGIEGKTFRPLAYTVALAMLGSLLFALILAPALSQIFMRRPKLRPGSSAGSEGRVIRWLTAAYRPVAARLVSRRWIALALVGVLLALGAVVIPLLGSEFTPTLQEGTIVVRLTMAPSISLRESVETTLRVERRLLKVSEVAGVTSRIGRGEVGAHADPINSAEIFVLLKPKEEWRFDSQERIEHAIRDELGEIPGVLVNLTQPIQMTVDELLEGVRAELAIKLFGEDLATLERKADEIADVVRNVRGASDVQVDQVSGTPQLLVRVDREAIARYGVNVSDVQQVVHAAVGGEAAGQIFQGVRRFEILVRYEERYRDTVEAIRQILVPGPGGLRVPLDQLARIEEVVGPRQITRENAQRFVTIQCNVTDRDIGSFVSDAQEAIKRSVKLPPGYWVAWGGQFRLQQEANRRLLIVVPVTLLIVLFLLTMSFHSFRSSLLLLINIPLALVGGVVGLWVAGENLSVPASVGFVALFGIALGNGMVLVNCLNRLVLEGVPVDEASVQGASLRLRSVLMTALTTLLGLIPLLFATGAGSEVQRPLAVVVIGGLATSTAMTLLVVPALYRWFAPEVQSDRPTA